MKKTLFTLMAFLVSQSLWAARYSCTAVNPEVEGLGVIKKISINQEGTLYVELLDEEGVLKKSRIKGVVETTGVDGEFFAADWDYGEHYMKASVIDGEYHGILVFKQDFEIEVRCRAEK